MALWRCTDCDTRYWVGAPYCPHCASTDHQEDGMPKIHEGRPPTYEPTEEMMPASIEFEPLPAAQDGEQVERISRPKLSPRRRSTFRST